MTDNQVPDPAKLWTPADMDGLLAWHDQDSFETLFETLWWMDKSGNGNHMPIQTNEATRLSLVELQNKHLREQLDMALDEIKNRDATISKLDAQLNE